MINRREFIGAVGALTGIGAAAVSTTEDSDRGGDSATAPPSRGPSTYQEAIRVVVELPIVKHMSAALDRVNQQTGSRVTTHLRIEDEPQEQARVGSRERMWQVAVAEGHPERLFTLYRFRVDADTGAVYVPEIFPDTLITYEEWEQRRAERSELSV